MTDQFPILSIHNDELAEWYGIGWAYIEPAEVPGYSIIAWRHLRPAVMPFSPSRAVANEYINRVPKVIEGAGDAVV